jgi:hypothetical protein
VDEPETFWPPPPDELRRWRLRSGLFFVAPGSALILLGLGVYSAVALTENGFDLAQHMQRILPFVAIVAVVIPLLAFIMPRLMARELVKALDVAKARVVRKEGERALVLCIALFLEKKYRRGFLVVTDRRLLRLEPTPAGSKQAELARRDEVATIELTERRSTRNALVSAFLKTMQSERGLTLTTKDGRRGFLVTDGFILDPLFAWFEREGFTTGFRNDADLSTAVPLTAPVFAEARIPGELGRQRRKLALAFVPLLLGLLLPLSILAFKKSPPVVPPFVLGAPGASVPGLPAMVVSVDGFAPALSRARVVVRKGGVASEGSGSESLPPGAERVVEQFLVRGRNEARRIDLLRLGETPVLRVEYPGWVPGDDTEYEIAWEPIGSAGETDADLVAAAKLRFAFLARAGLDVAADARLPTIARSGEAPPTGPESKVCIIEVWKATGPNRYETEHFGLVRVGPVAILRPEYRGGSASSDWERVGSPGDTDDALLDEAMARLAALSKAAP